MLLSGRQLKRAGRGSCCQTTAAKSPPKGFGKKAPPPPKQPPTPPPLAAQPPVPTASFGASSPPPPPIRAPPPPPAEDFPEIVSERILARIVGFALPPVLLGFGSGPAAYYVSKVLKVEILPAALYTLGSVLFGTAALGAYYGFLSASWDPAERGTRLGWEEFQRNWAVYTKKK